MKIIQHSHFLKTMLLSALITSLFCMVSGAAPPASQSRFYILAYHNLIDQGEPDSMSISQEKFRTDLEWLSQNGYQTILPYELCDLRSRHLPPPQKTVMIVFDDGYYSNYALAFPILKETKMKAAIMLITAQIKDTEPDGSLRVAPLSWDDVKEMSESGLVEFGSHTNKLHNPDRGGIYISGEPNGIQSLKGETRINYRLRLDADIKQSISLIRDHTGQSVVSFAYPFGIKDKWSSKTLLENGIKITFLTGNNTANISRGLYDLARFSVKEDTDLSKLLSISP